MVLLKTLKESDHNKSSTSLYEMDLKVHSILTL